MDLNIAGVFSYFVFLGMMLGVAAGLMFTLRAIKLI